MAKETSTDRVNVAIAREIHTTLAHVATLLGKDLKEATEEAVQEWIKKHATAAKRKSAQLLPA
jgi:adenosylcobinamide amidohydrolase